MKVKVNMNITLWILAIAFTACDKTSETSTDQNDITGYWINRQAHYKSVTFERSGALKDNEYCIEIAFDGKFTERKNSGWCGTPPIAYADFEGTWERNDSIINITVEYWGGWVDYQWKIIAIDNNKLSIIPLVEEYHYSE